MLLKTVNELLIGDEVFRLVRFKNPRNDGFNWSFEQEGQTIVEGGATSHLLSQKSNESYDEQLKKVKATKMKQQSELSSHSLLEISSIAGGVREVLVA